MHIAVIMRYKLVPHYIFGSTGIICMFAKIYGKINNPPLVIGLRMLLFTMVGYITCTMQDKNWQWRY